MDFNKKGKQNKTMLYRRVIFKANVRFKYQTNFTTIIRNLILKILQKV